MSAERERRFVEALMGEAAGNATHAAILAGYAAKSAHVTGSRLLRKPKVKAAIESRVKSDPAVWTRKDRQRFWTEVAQGKHDARMPDRLKASELLGKSQRDFVEQVEHSGKDGKPLVFTLNLDARDSDV